MPIAGEAARKCPLHILPAQSTRHLRIQGDVLWIIIIDEIIVEHRPKSGQGCSREEQADEECAPAFFDAIHRLSFCAIHRPSAKTIPKGLRPPAQGCEARATLGNRRYPPSQPRRGCAHFCPALIPHVSLLPPDLVPAQQSPHFILECHFLL